jgi:chromate transporter
MIARLREELVSRQRWLTGQEFSEGLALTQVIPGATVVQMATYVGCQLRGTRGALTAAVSFILPSFSLMVLLTALYTSQWALPVVRPLFRGLGAVVVALILNACLVLGRTTLHGRQGAALAVLALFAITLKVGLPLVLAGAALLAIPLYERARSSGPPAGPRPQ